MKMMRDILLLLLIAAGGQVSAQRRLVVVDVETLIPVAYLTLGRTIKEEEAVPAPAKK